MTVTARNNTRETRARKFWFDHAFLAVLPTASSPKISGTAGGRVRVQKRTRDAALLRIDFGSRLYSGKTRKFKVTFDLVDKGTPTDRAIRVGPSLVTLPVWAHASTGAKGGTVTVRVPAGYEVAVENGTFATTTTAADGGTELATKTLAKPLAFFAYVSAQKPAAYTETPLSVTAGDDTIELLLNAWSDDTAWATRVGDLFTRSLPVLREEIGLPWPHDDAAHRPGGGQPEQQRLHGAVRPRREPGRGRLLGRSCRRHPRGRPRVVQRLAARGPLGERGVRVALRTACRGGDRRGRDRSGAHGRHREGRHPAQRVGPGDDRR